MNGSGTSLAIAPVTGTLQGCTGTDVLAGITGTLTIDLKNGKHFYRFDDTLP